jgi:predicted glycosyltransferase
MKLMVYSHDTFGLGNIRRMLAVCDHLLSSLPGLSILLVTGSPMIHSFRLPKGLDYIKLPCLNRGDRGRLSAKYLATEVDETLKLRAELILAAASYFKPDLLLVDKKPAGLREELDPTLEYLKHKHPSTKLVLLLRDILDEPEKTIAEWQKFGYYEAIRAYYDRILVVGMPEVFNLSQAYQFPPDVADKVRFCGYIQRTSRWSREEMRQVLQIPREERLILVTAGGGEDGYFLIDHYLSGLDLLPRSHNLKSIILCGPEMAQSDRETLYRKAAHHSSVQINEFSEELTSYIAAADVVAAMGGYNTTCEILAAKRKAIIVPRIEPSQEQLIRAERLAQLGLVKFLHPNHLTPRDLMRSVLTQLSASSKPSNFTIDLNALPRITRELLNLFSAEANRRDLNHWSSHKLGPFVVGAIAR